MRVLAFDTATSATSVALAAGESVLERRDDPPPGERPRHAARLMPLIAEVLAEAGWGVGELDRIAVGVGPGTFTGLRIGVATARGLALARGIDVVGISTLESLALNVDVESVCAVLDARRQEVFAAVWRGGEAVLEPTALSPAELAPQLDASTLAIGDGAIAFRSVLERSGAMIPDDGADVHRVTAANHCRIALRMPTSGPNRVLPDYLRIPDAELARRSATKQ